MYVYIILLLFVKIEICSDEMKETSSLPIKDINHEIKREID